MDVDFQDGLSYWLERFPFGKLSSAQADFVFSEVCSLFPNETLRVQMGCTFVLMAKIWDIPLSVPEIAATLRMRQRPLFEAVRLMNYLKKETNSISRKCKAGSLFTHVA